MGTSAKSTSLICLLSNEARNPTDYFKKKKKTRERREMTPESNFSPLSGIFMHIIFILQHHDLC